MDSNTKHTEAGEGYSPLPPQAPPPYPHHNPYSTPGYAPTYGPDVPSYGPGAPPAGQPPLQIQMAVQPAPVMPSHTVVINNQGSGRMVCPNCHMETQTGMRKVIACSGYFWCICLFMFGFVFGCCLIPLCMDSCKKRKYYCINCGHTF